jgi:hypothetical protein
LREENNRKSIYGSFLRDLNGAQLFSVEYSAAIMVCDKSFEIIYGSVL